MVGVKVDQHRVHKMHFGVSEVLPRSTLVPAWEAHSIPALDASCSVFSRAQRFTGHNLEQLLGSGFMVIVSKWIHTNLRLQRQHIFPTKILWKWMVSISHKALEGGCFKIQLKLWCHDLNQHLHGKRQDGELQVTYGNGMQIICISHWISVPYVRFNQGIW